MKEVETTGVALMINAHIRPPTPGAKVNALNHGGVCVPVVWTNDSINHFDAWAPFFKVPDDVKAIQASRFPTVPRETKD